MILPSSVFLEMNFNRSSFLTSDGSRRKKQMLPPEIHSVLQALGFSFQVLLSVCLLPGAAALVAISFASFIACFLNSSSYCFPVPIDDTLLCFYYTLIVFYVSSFIIQDLEPRGSWLFTHWHLVFDFRSMRFTQAAGKKETARSLENKC